MSNDTTRVDQEFRSGGRFRVWGSFLLGSLVVLALTLRFPPSDFPGWLATSLGVPLWGAYAALAALALAGALLTMGLKGTPGSIAARWLNLILFGGTLISTVGELLGNQ